MIYDDGSQALVYGPIEPQPPGSDKEKSRDSALEIQRYLKRHTALLMDRASYEGHWKDLADFVSPRRLRFSISEQGKGTKRNDKIINSTATKAHRVMTSGMHAGISSPVRPWMRMQVADVSPEINERDDVKRWIALVLQRMYTVMAKSNFYNGLSTVYGDLGLFATAVIWIDEDDDDIIRTYNLVMGEYCLTVDDCNRVNGIYRHLGWTVEQIVDRFGYDACSEFVKNLFTAEKFDQIIEIMHIVEPRGLREDADDAINMPYKSIWFEKATHAGKYLRESGYRTLPFMAARWSVSGNEVYGTSCPAMDALGDIKGLQQLERRKAQIADKLNTPPMKGPSSLRNQRASLLPGDITYVDSTIQGQTFEPALRVEPQSIAVISQEIARHENRIGDTFMVDIWLMMATNDRTQPVTAREVDERHDEKMLQLGPTLERVHDELLDPAVVRVFDIMRSKGLIPPPPAALRNATLDVEYINVLAQAQKLIATDGVQRLATFTANLANVDQQIIDNVNWDEMVREYADLLGVDPKILVPDDVVKQIREKRAEAQRSAQEAQQAAEQAKAIQALGRTPMDTSNALTEMLGAAGGGQYALSQAQLPEGA